MKNITSKNNVETMRIAKYLSHAGVDARRKCEELIKEGKVTVNNQIITDLSFQVSPKDTVLLNGKKIKKTVKTYIMLNKPVGYICSVSDPYNQKTIYDLIKLKTNQRLFSAGRLDVNSEGLIIITNDGEYAEKLTHPKHQTEKKYKVKIDSPLSEKDITLIKKGIYDKGEFLKPKSIRATKRNEYLVTMTEGKKREVRRIFAAVFKKVYRLKRVSIGNLKLTGIPIGKWRHMTEDEIKLSLSKDEKRPRRKPQQKPRTTTKKNRKKR